MAAKNIDYSKLEYWDERYQKDGKDLYDWFGESFDVELLSHFPSKMSQPTILHLGCGNSALGEKLYKEGYRKVTNVDFSPSCIRLMQERYSATDYPEMEWIVADIFNLSTLGSDRLFDIAIDKGTLDSFLTEKFDPWDPPTHLKDKMEQYMRSVSTQLKPDGVFIHFTWSQPHFRKVFLELGKIFTTTVHTISDREGGGFDFFIYKSIKL